ncbi:MAG: methyltransferase domain-containing protein [Bacteroidetes bacterium]|nr:methyltransferase domain-containing protein [Bacteroidota bacterium]
MNAESSLEPFAQGNRPSLWYEDWFDSPWYSLLYRHRDESEAKLFLDRLIRWLEPRKESRMLDLACGQGRHARYLAELGFDVTGIDLSPRNITEARLWENERLSFYEHDMRFPFRINYYEYIFNFFTSFGYFERASENQQSLNSIRLGLRPEGKLVIDFLNVAFAADHLVREEIREEAGVRFLLNRRFTGDHFVKDIRVEKGGDYRLYQERVQAITINQFEQSFKVAGLRLVCAFGSYDLEPYDRLNSPRLIMVVEKVAG